MKFSIGAREFKSKGDATRAVKRILHNSPINQLLEGEDRQLICDLYQLHPRKEGNPVSFCVGENNFHGAWTRGFHGICEDGRKIQFSYMPCLSPAKDAPSLLNAMRAAIIPSQREALRAKYANRALVECSNPNCKTALTIENAQVHHMSPKFRDIADAFVALIGEPDVSTAVLGDDFTHLGIKKRWILFHDSVAQRVILCAKCNQEDEKTND